MLHRLLAAVLHRLLAAVPLRLLARLRWAGHDADLISALPDDVLLLLLARLGCAREAARTSVLSRRWRDLWTRAPELAFRGVHPDAVEAALARLDRPKLRRLDIEVDLASQAAASLLRAAARLEPETFSATMHRDVDEEESVASDSIDEEEAVASDSIDEEEAVASDSIELPCFDRTESLALALPWTFTPPPTGEFTRLRRLELASWHTDPGALLCRCPCLRALRIHAVIGLEAVTVHSATLEELRLRTCDPSGVPRIDIDAPELKKVKLDVDRPPEFSVSFSAPKVEKLDWDLRCQWENVGLPWLRAIVLTYRLSHGVRTLSLVTMSTTFIRSLADQSFEQEIAQLLSTDFSVLDLNHAAHGHAFGPSLLHLLQIRPVIRKLVLFLDYEEDAVESCPLDCPCRQPDNWRSESISLVNLEEVNIFGFKGGDDGADFLKLLFRCAPMLRRVMVGVSGTAYKDICSICEQYPHVDCAVRRDDVIT